MCTVYQVQNRNVKKCHTYVECVPEMYLYAIERKKLLAPANTR